MFDIASTCRAVQAHLRDSDLFASVEIERPLEPPGEGPSATIHCESMRVAETTLQSAIEVHVLAVRIYQGQFADGREVTEIQGAELVSKVLDLFYEDFTFGARVRAVDVAGMYGTGLSASWTDEDVSEQPVHLAEITLPIIVDSATSFAA